MHARMSTLEGATEEMDEALRDVREHVMPQLKQQEGFKGFIALGNRQSGEYGPLLGYLVLDLLGAAQDFLHSRVPDRAHDLFVARPNNLLGKILAHLSTSKPFRSPTVGNCGPTMGPRTFSPGH
jgi:hypothetical protein